MARLQILELPAEHHGDDMVTPFVLVIDQVTEDEGARLIESQDVTNSFAVKAGARAVVAFHGMTMEIPANDTAPVTVDDPERAGITQIVYAHERTRLDLCGALLLSGDTTWRKLIEHVSERQRELADLYRERDELHAEIGLAQGQLHSAVLGAVRGKHANIRELIERAEQAEAARDEARQWARHGYEIGQKHCGWTDYGVAPGWLTESWPTSFDSCEHLKQAAEYDTALSRVLEVAAELEAAEAHGGAWDANQQAARSIRVAVGRPRAEDGSGS